MIEKKLKCKENKDIDRKYRNNKRENENMCKN